MAGEDEATAEERERVEWWLTPTARSGYRALSRRHRVTQAAFVEALGRLGNDGDPTMDEIVTEAGRIDAERRSRQRDR